jgi:tetratricopeptide (TPR) repeat protein
MRVSSADNTCMKHLWRILTLSTMMIPAVIFAQSTAVGSLLARARTQEQSGHLDLAAQTWQQVILVDTHDREALAGLARWSKLTGRDKEAEEYLSRLRQANPNDSQVAKQIASIRSTPSNKTQTEQLQKASQLARAGQASEALRIYREIWGSHPPDGDWALTYYDTEAALETLRPDAVTSLRALARKYPSDARYSVTLGRILTYTSQTRPEGIRLLKQFPLDQAAVQALQQAEAWNATAIQPEQNAHQEAQRHRDAAVAATTSELWAAVQRGTEALAANRPEDAIANYKAALVLRPNTVEALNGLSGSYMRAGRPSDAIAIYHQLIKLQPVSSEAWLGLFNAQLQADQPAAAIDTAKHLPPTLKITIQNDRSYLRRLASAYIAIGQTSEAQNALAEALALPMASGQPDTETRLQYAALLADGKRLADAAALYRQVLFDDPESLDAWRGLISTQHRAAQDADAIATVERMSPATYDAALEDTDFLTLLANIYQQQNRYDLALEILQRAARNNAAKHQPVPINLQLQMAATYMQQNHPDQAYAIFRGVLGDHPDSTVAWKGLITTLHETHHDREALAQLHQLPAKIRSDLVYDVDYNQAVAGVYAATGNNAAALQLIAQIQQHYRSQNSMAPADVDIQNGWLLLNTHDDRDLYRALMALGDREDLTDLERRSVQNIWATWSVRRASDAVDAGNLHRSLEILNAAAQAFPDNPDVLKALASGYLKSGDPRRSMIIFATLDLTNASVSDYQSMVSAALAAPDLHQAEIWLRGALDKFSNDSNVLALAARFEQARGDHARASRYWKASLSAAPAVDPANRLVHTLDRADAQARPLAGGALSGLLDPDQNLETRASRPALPGYRNASPSPQSYTNDNSLLYGPDPYVQGVAPVPVENSTPHNDHPIRPATASDSASHAETLPPTFADSTYSADAFAPPDLFSRPQPAPMTLDRELADPSNPLLASNPSLHLLGSGPFSAAPQAPQIETSSSAAPTDTLYLQPQTVPVLKAIAPLGFGQMIAAPRSSDLQSQQPLSSGVIDQELQQQNLPPLRGIWTARTPAQASETPSDPREIAERQLANFVAQTSPWKGASGYVTHRTGTPGFDQLYILEAPFESSTTIGGNTRLTAIVTPSLLASGTSTGTSTTYQLGTLSATSTPNQQNASGVGGEGQLDTADISLAAGTTPRGFLISSVVGRLSLHPASRPFRLDLAREAVKDSQLSYSGLLDPGSTNSAGASNRWGGVISNAANLQFGRGNEQSGYYAGFGGQYITGLNVLNNKRIDGTAGAYWKLAHLPGSYEFTLGANFFGMHYDHNLRYFTYGQGGYFSPSIYFLASVPFSLKGQYGTALHYEISGGIGLQAFQEASSLYFPLHVDTVSSAIKLPSFAGQSALPAGPIFPIPVPFNNPSYPAQSVIGSNYDLHGEVSQHVIDRWYIGGFFVFNNTRNYASQTVGFFIRYMSRSATSNLDATAPDAPTGIFPYSGFRPLLVP